MSKTVQNDVKLQVNGVNTQKTNLEVLNFQETALLKFVIGPLNFKRWYEIKKLLCCKSNEEFVGKLLDIAQEFLFGHNNTKSTSKENFKNGITVEKTTHLHTNNASQANEKVSQESENESLNIESAKEVVNKPNSESLEPIVAVKEENKQSKKKKSTSPTKKEKVKDYDVRKAPQLKIQNDNTKENSSTSADSKFNLCQNCNTRHSDEQCPINSPREIILDSVNIKIWNEKYKSIHENQNIKNIKCDSEEDIDRNKFVYARVSLPSCLCLTNIAKASHGLGVVSKRQVQPFTEFGPLIGNKVKEVDIQDDSSMRDIWEVELESGNIYINTEDLESSNWVRFIRPAPTRDERNLTVIFKENSIYFVNIKLLNEGDELLYWQDSSVSTNKKKKEKTICGGCNMKFAHPLYYRIHCSVFHDIRYSLTIRKYHCKVCGAAVLGKENIRKHAAELHNGQGAYQCQYCKKFFLRLNYLEMHRTYGCSANPHRARPLCDFCGRKFCQPQKLKVHIKRMHSSISEVLKEFQCKNCMKILGSRAALQRHMKEVHEKQVDGACSCIRCGKHFQNKSNLKIHMLTHSGIKPFRCAEEGCNAAFTTKQCLQFHYKKTHNFSEDNMPKIERSVDYTFTAYSGIAKRLNDSNDRENSGDDMDQEEKVGENENEEDSDLDDASLDSKSMDDPPALQSPLDLPEESSSMPPSQPPDPPSPPPQTSHVESYNVNQLVNQTSTMKVVSKGSKKWIADEPPLQTLKASDFYTIDRLSRDDLNIEDHNLYDRKISNMAEFTRHEPSNASLLVEAALDSVCNEPNIDIDVSAASNCHDTLVNNLYTLTQHNDLHEVSYSLEESRDISLMSPSVNDHISVTDELDNELRQSQNIGLDYSNFHQEGFSPGGDNSPTSIQRANFVKNYINSLSPAHNNYDEGNKNPSPCPSPPRYDFGHNINTENISSDESNGMAAQNLSLHGTKNDIQLDLSMYKTPSYKMPDYLRRLKFEGEMTSMSNANNIPLESEVDIVQDMSNGLQEKEDRNKYHDDLSAEIRSKFELDLDMRLKNYENSIDTELLRQRGSYDINTDLEFRNKNYDLIESTLENRITVETDFRTDRNFEPLALNSSELQGLDMSARSFHNYTNINRYHHLYPEVDRVDLRLNYTPPPPPYDLMRVVSIDLTPPGRHSVDLSLRSHPLHPIANTRLLTEHALPSNHRLLDQSRLLTGDLSTSRIGESRLLSETSARILSDHTTNRILGNNDHLAGSDQSRLLTDDSRLLSDQSRLLDQRSLLGDTRILPAATATGTVSPPIPPFGAYSGVSQAPYHPTPITPRAHVSSPTNAGYHHPYPTYYP